MPGILGLLRTPATQNTSGYGISMAESPCNKTQDLSDKRGNNISGSQFTNINTYTSVKSILHTLIMIKTLQTK